MCYNMCYISHLTSTLPITPGPLQSSLGPSNPARTLPICSRSFPSLSLETTQLECYQNGRFIACYGRRSCFQRLTFQYWMLLSLDTWRVMKHVYHRVMLVKHVPRYLLYITCNVDC